MLDPSRSHPISDFTDRTQEYVRRLKETGSPEVLTVNGQPEIVIQSTEAYERLLDAAGLAETLPILRESLPQADRGEGRPRGRSLKGNRGFGWH